LKRSIFWFLAQNNVAGTQTVINIVLQHFNSKQLVLSASNYVLANIMLIQMDYCSIAAGDFYLTVKSLPAKDLVHVFTQNRMRCIKYLPFRLP
jgi:urea transporter